MIKKQSDIEREKIWQDHLKKAAEFGGSGSAYCRAAGIRDHDFYYWKKKLSPKTSIPSISNPFLAVKIQTPEARKTGALSLPDPAWVAAILLHLQAGLK